MFREWFEKGLNLGCFWCSMHVLLKLLYQETECPPHFLILSSATQACIFHHSSFSMYLLNQIKLNQTKIKIKIHLFVPVGSVNYERQNARLYYDPANHSIPYSLQWTHH